MCCISPAIVFLPSSLFFFFRFILFPPSHSISVTPHTFRTDQTLHSTRRIRLPPFFSFYTFFFSFFSFFSPPVLRFFFVVNKRKKAS
ncbi:hypothetical protein BKA57DRAFT_271000 [Linnemannia elongata]|nr:hypothetical protein BKA57DRAFT_271000 [Linnemannia elongata]